MKSRILNVVAAAAITVSASALYAQSGNGSDVSGPPGGGVAGGTWVPFGGGGIANRGRGGGGGRVGNANPNAAPAIANVAASFSNGSPQTSPATGQTIPPAAVAQIGALISGGSPASVAQVSTALQAGGAAPAQTAALVQALAALANVSAASAPQAIVNAAQAFNALVRSLSASFLANPPADFIAIQAALAPMVASITH
jgi:hypothetical protein